MRSGPNRSSRTFPKFWDHAENRFAHRPGGAEFSTWKVEVCQAICCNDGISSALAARCGQGFWVKPPARGKARLEADEWGQPGECGPPAANRPPARSPVGPSAFFWERLHGSNWHAGRCARKSVEKDDAGGRPAWPTAGKLVERVGEPRRLRGELRGPAAQGEAMDFVRPTAAAAPCLIGRATAARVLIVGPFGQGVGLAADALALAAEHSGSPATTVACMRPALERRACATLVRLGDVSDASASSADLLLAFDLAAAVAARPLLSPSGLGLVLTLPQLFGGNGRLRKAFEGRMLDGAVLESTGLESTGLDGRFRCWPGRTRADAPLARAWTLLGWLSRQITLPHDAWRPALEASVPRRLNLAAQLAFARGRAIDARLRRF